MASHQPTLLSFAPITSTPESAISVSAITQYSSNGINGKDVTHQSQHKADKNSDRFIGYLEVFVHQAREIQNVCIYHKQDVYAKIFLTSHPDATASTKTINGGGRNPVFNEKLRLDVQTVESSLKCEIYMLSRVKNYLQDQLLGVALIPLSQILMADGTLEQEFSLSATDLYHSPSGFVQLSLNYVGSSPEVIVVPTPVTFTSTEPVSENDKSIPSTYEKIEFPDLNVVEENNQMVSEYFGIPCADLDSQPSEILISGNEEGADDEAGIRVVENFAQEGVVVHDDSATSIMRKDSPASSVSTNETPWSVPATSQASSNQSSVVLASPDEKDKRPDAVESEADSSENPITNNTLVPPLIKLNLEPEQAMKQEDFVDMYMKSMQQFTESLAKMKLPLDIESNVNNLENANTDATQKVEATRESGSRVFYGSRAFF